MPNGCIGVYNTIEKSEAVWIIPVTTNGEIALIYTFRHTVGDWCWEIPAGGVKPEQSVAEAARQELYEEVGGVAEVWEYCGRFYTASGICNEVGHFFMATGVTLGEPAHEAAEVIKVHCRPIAEVLYMARSGDISDAQSVMALLLCQERLRALPGME